MKTHALDFSSAYKFGPLKVNTSNDLMAKPQHFIFNHLPRDIWFMKGRTKYNQSTNNSLVFTTFFSTTYVFECKSHFNSINNSQGCSNRTRKQTETWCAWVILILINHIICIPIFIVNRQQHVRGKIDEKRFY